MNAGILIVNQAEELDFMGHWEILTTWRSVAVGPNCLLVAQSFAPVLCVKARSVNPTTDCKHGLQPDYLPVPGGQGTTPKVNNSMLVHFVASQARNRKAILSVCTGSLILHPADLPTGKRAATHRGSLERLRVPGDAITVEERFVQDGSVWSSADVSAGIDLKLTFISQIGVRRRRGKYTSRPGVIPRALNRVAMRITRKDRGMSGAPDHSFHSICHGGLYSLSRASETKRWLAGGAVR